MERADVVIVGGGIVGASIGTTSPLAECVTWWCPSAITSAGIDRAATGTASAPQFSTEIKCSCRCARCAHRAFPGGDGRRSSPPTGRLPVPDHRGARRRSVEKSLAMWKRLGVPAQRLDSAGVTRVFPSSASTMCASRRSVRVMVTVIRRASQRLRRAREGEGCDLPRGAASQRDHARGDRVPACARRQGDIACQTVVMPRAHGAPRRSLDGIDLPIRPLRRADLRTDPFPSWTTIPLTSSSRPRYTPSRVRWRADGHGRPTDGPGFDSTVNWDFLPTLVRARPLSATILERANVKTAGRLLEDTPQAPDHRRGPGRRGLPVRGRLFGHGIMPRPRRAKPSRRWVDGRTSLDVHPSRTIGSVAAT